MAMPKLPPLAAVRAFESAARLENFSRAAEELGMTQAAVSYQVRQLEDRLGRALFVREKGRVRLSETGQRVFPAIRAAFAAMHDAFAALGSDETDVLTISAVTSFGGAWLSARIGRFQLAYPDLAVRMSMSNDLVDFDASNVDVAIRLGMGPWPGLRSDFLMRQTLAPLAAPSFIAEHAIREPADLLRVQRLAPNDSWWADWFVAAGVATPLARSRLGIELDTYGLTAFNYRLVADALDGFCTLEDASNIVRVLRLVKSPAELAYTRRAGELADDALLAMIETAGPGVLDGTVTAAGMSVILSGGGDMPPDGPIVNSGPRAVYGRSVGGGHVLDPQDQIMIEFAATFARYNVCIERTVIIGKPDDQHLRMFSACRDALFAMTEAAKPGRPIGEIDDQHRRVLDAAGFGAHRYGACGYSLGNTYRPSWMDAPPMIFSGNPLIAEPGMVFFPHVMLGDADKRLAIGVGYTIVITETGCEVLSKLPVELPVRN